VNRRIPVDYILQTLYLFYFSNNVPIYLYDCVVAASWWRHNRWAWPRARAATRRCHWLFAICI